MRRLFPHEIVSYRYFIFSVLLSTIDNRGKNNAELAVQLEIFLKIENSHALLSVQQEFSHLLLTCADLLLELVTTLPDN